jgi:hypothetical protein
MRAADAMTKQRKLKMRQEASSQGLASSFVNGGQ